MIRPLNLDSTAERRRVLELVRQSQYMQHVVHDHRDTDEESRRTAAVIWRYNLANPAMAYFVYEVDGRVVGYVLLRRLPDNTAFIDDLGVDAGFRRQGIGQALVEYGIMWAKSEGMDAMKLTTQRVNLAAAATYRKAGFADIDSEYIDFELKL